MRRIVGLLLVLVAGCASKSPASSDGGVSTGGGGSWLTGFAGALLSSSDGTTFRAARAGTAADLNGIYCVNGRRGWAVGAGGALVTTVDAGATWEARATGVTTTLRAVAFADYQTGLAVGDGGTVLRSTDGGVSWTKIAAGVDGLTLRAVAIAQDGALAWVAGDGGTMLRSTDGGQHFTKAAGVPAVRLSAVRFSTDGQRGYAVGDAILGSSDGGASWSAFAGAASGLRGLSVTHDGGRAVAVGAGGLTMRSSDGGVSWTRGDTGSARDLNAIGFADDDPNTGWAVGAHGTILRTSDGGAHFAALASPADVELTSVEDF